MKTYLLFAALGLSAALFSCKDEDPKPVNPGNTPTLQPNDNPNNLTYTQILTGRTWKLTGFAQGAPGSPTVTDLFASGVPNCQKDDLYKFAIQDSAATVEEGTAKCSANGNTRTGKWYLKNAQSVLYMKVSGQNPIGLSGDFSIQSLGETKMTLKQTVSGSDYYSTFTAQ